MERPSFCKPVNFNQMTEEEKKELLKKQRREYAYWKRNNDPEYHAKQLKISRDYKAKKREENKEEFNNKVNQSCIKYRKKKQIEYNAMKDILQKLKISINEAVI